MVLFTKLLVFCEQKSRKSLNIVMDVFKWTHTCTLACLYTHLFVFLHKREWFIMTDLCYFTEYCL